MRCDASFAMHSSTRACLRLALHQAGRQRHLRRLQLLAQRRQLWRHGRLPSARHDATRVVASQSASLSAPACFSTVRWSGPDAPAAAAAAPSSASWQHRGCATREPASHKARGLRTGAVCIHAPFAPHHSPPARRLRWSQPPPRARCSGRRGCCEEARASPRRRAGSAAPAPSPGRAAGAAPGGACVARALLPRRPRKRVSRSWSVAGGGDAE